MEFKSLKNIETSFKQIRLFAIVFVLMCTLVSGYSIWSSYSFAEAQRQKIYVFDQGKTLMLALAQDAAQNRPAEAIAHVKRFHEFFFTVPPDKKAIEHNIKCAMTLSDKSAYKYYKDMMEQGFYNRMIRGNISQVVEVDSVLCDFNSYPYNVRTYARQIIIRESTVTERNLLTRCSLMDIKTRTDDNPQAFIVENFEVLDNTEIGSYDRR